VWIRRPPLYGLINDYCRRSHPAGRAPRVVSPSAPACTRGPHAGAPPCLPPPHVMKSRLHRRRGCGRTARRREPPPASSSARLAPGVATCLLNISSSTMDGPTARDALRAWSGWASSVINWPRHKPDHGPRSYKPDQGPRQLHHRAAGPALDLRACGPTTLIRTDRHGGPVRWVGRARTPSPPSAFLETRRAHRAGGAVDLPGVNPEELGTHNTDGGSSDHTAGVKSHPQRNP
jgi:hypothetical protein